MSDAQARALGARRAASTGIQWTNKTWNPSRGCSLTSPGCTNCYAMQQAHRFSGVGRPYEGLTRLTAHGPVWTGEVRLADDKTLDKPLHWRVPQLVFVNSMSDLFHENLPLVDIQRVFDVMVCADWHTYQILTKRSERLRELHDQLPWPRHIHMGVSVENADYAHRVDDLRATGAHTKFLSIEPLLGPLNNLNLDRIDWVIIGGESGARARPMDLDWVRSIVAQCRAANVPVFVKQLGAKPIDGGTQLRLEDRHGGDPDEWPGDLRIREFPVPHGGRAVA